MRRVVVTVLALAAVWAPAFGGAPVTASPDAEHRFVELLAGERAAHSLAAYAVEGDLADVARRHAQRMAAENRLHHNPNLGEEVKDWEVVGENVGRGPDVDSIHRAFMDSPTHRGEILSAEFTQVGVGVHLTSSGEVWVAQVFRKPMAAPAAAPPPTPAAAPPETTAPPPPAPAAARRAGRAAAPPRATPAPAPLVVAPAPAEPLGAVAWPAELDALGAALAVEPLPATTLAAASVRGAGGSPALGSPAPVPAAAEPDVTLAVRVAATLLVLVVALQTAYVRRQLVAPAPSTVRRQRSQASMKPSMSPSSTAVTLPVS